MDGVTSSPAGRHDDDDESVDVLVVVQHCAPCPWSAVTSRRASSWHPARHHDSVTVTLASSQTGHDVVRRALDLSPPPDLPAVVADYELVDVELDSVGRSVSERVVPLDDHVRLLVRPRTSLGRRRRLELRACPRRRTCKCSRRRSDVEGCRAATVR